ncbi:MAG TPA: serine protease [Planctomycetota bacterium]|nr:serine protease [Planctomycetota bacterium]
MSRWLLCWTLLTLALCRAEEPANPGGSVFAVDDKQITKRIHDQAAALIAAGKTTKISALIEQLKNTSCRVQLPLTARTPPPDRLYEHCRPSVLIMAGIFKCDKCSDWHVAPASGFALSADGVCVTNYHVVDAPARETLVAMTSEGQVYPVKAVLAASKRDDIAILQLDGAKLSPAPLLPNAAVGSKVSVISHPDGRFYMLTAGIISRYFVSSRNQSASNMMAITADYARGSSGAAVFNERGEIVGMVASTQSIYYENKDGKQENLQMVVKQCVPAASILKLIEK